MHREILAPVLRTPRRKDDAFVRSPRGRLGLFARGTSAFSRVVVRLAWGSAPRQPINPSHPPRLKLERFCSCVATFVMLIVGHDSKSSAYPMIAVRQMGVAERAGVSVSRVRSYHGGAGFHPAADGCGAGHGSGGVVAATGARRTHFGERAAGQGAVRTGGPAVERFATGENRMRGRHECRNAGAERLGVERAAQNLTPTEGKPSGLLVAGGGRRKINRAVSAGMA